jgi:hypothetical protein
MWLALPIRALARLAQVQESGGTCSEARGRGGLGQGTLAVIGRPLILKHDPVGQNPEDYSVLEDGIVVGRIFKVPIAPPERPWMWASGDNGDISRADARLRADARGRHGRVRQELAEGMTDRRCSLHFALDQSRFAKRA